ncbi:MAG: hypothetical protein QNJ63_17005 [Calothrix sp. MO_192.B10]|nr:hypothetical protein [Calothrix sp. MO_192.B10]
MTGLGTHWWVSSDRRSVAELSNLVDQDISRALLAVKGARLNRQIIY